MTTAAMAAVKARSNNQVKSKVISPISNGRGSGSLRPGPFRNIWIPASLLLLLLLRLPDENSRTGAGASRFGCVLVSALSTPASSVHTIGVDRAFSALVSDPAFISETWQKRAQVLQPTGAAGSNIRGHFTVDDVRDCVDEQFIVAGRGSFQEGRGGWNMAAVGSKPRSNNFEDAKLRFEDVQDALNQKSGTVVVNSAGAYMPSLAKVCEECLSAFGFPVNMNMYLTAFGQQTSAPPHTDVPRC